MDAKNKRREATRRQLEQQLKERQVREARRKRVTLISSVVGTVAVVALVIVLVVVLAGGSDDTKPKAGASATGSTAAAAAGSPGPCAAPTGAATASYQGATVGNAIDLKKDPKAGSSSTAVPTVLACDDLVVGKGAAATPTSTVSVQYSGVLYSNGKAFDSSWARGGQPTSFSLTGVVPGFTQGIGGTGKVTPMRVGGRRIIIVPAALAYGANPPSGSNIPANAPLVFVVDLVKVS